MPSAADIQKAIEAGRKQAEAVVKARKVILKKRADAITKVQAKRPKGVSPVVPPKLRPVGRPAAPPPAPGGTPAFIPYLGPKGHSTLIAEGDSWFDYPGDDVLRILEDEHGYEVESVAHWGDRIEEMAYSGDQLEKLTRKIEKVLRDGRMPRAILLSGGGNDIAGDDFAIFLNHAQSQIRGLNESIVTGVIDQRIMDAYLKVITRVTGTCEAMVQTRIPILVHGYAHPIPDGRGFWGGWWFLPGPWLKPGLAKKAYKDLSENVGFVKTLIDRFNTMLQGLVSAPGLEHVHYVDVRPILPLSDDKNAYKALWDNELHPTPGGFKKVAKKFADTLGALPAP